MPIVAGIYMTEQLVSELENRVKELFDERRENMKKMKRTLGVCEIIFKNPI